MKTFITLCLVSVAILAQSALGQNVTTWTGNGTDATDWKDSANWSDGVPTASTVANLVYPAGAGPIYISSNSSVLGLIYGEPLVFWEILATDLGVTLTIGSSGITNNNITQGTDIVHGATTSLGANCTFTAGPLAERGLIMNDFSINAYTLNVAASTGTLFLQGETSFSVSSSTQGKISGSGSVQFAGAVSFNFTSAVGVGSWDFISQAPTGSPTGVKLADYYNLILIEETPGNGAGSSGGLDWTYIASTGVLTAAAVPEPSTWALFAFSLTVVTVLRRRRNS